MLNLMKSAGETFWGMVHLQNRSILLRAWVLRTCDYFSTTRHDDKSI